MRYTTTLLLLFLTFGLTSCNRGDDLPTLVPTIDLESLDGEGLGDESPRATPDPGLPPTWTPAPTSEPATPLPPLAATPETTNITYVIQRGDTLGIIAQRYGVTVEELAALNNITDINRIEVGDTLLIPQPAE
jgi:LysM repeat protein